MVDTYPKSNSPRRPGILGRTDSYDPEELMPGAFPEAGDTTYPSTVDIQVDEATSETLKAQTPISHYVAQTADAPRTQTPTQINHNVEGFTAGINRTSHDVEEIAKPYSESDSTSHPTLQSTHNVSTNMKVSGNLTTLPSALHDEYYRFHITHEDDDPLDSSEVVCDDEVPLVDVSSMVIPGRRSEKWPYEGTERASDYTSGGYTPGDGSEKMDRGYGESDIAFGYGGVTYNRSGRDGVLPGYPTQEGISRLVFDRMMDDQLRLAGVANSTSLAVPAAAVPMSNDCLSKSTKNYHDVRGSDSGEEGKVPFPVDLRILEGREGPIFENGSSSAPDKCETTYQPATPRSSRETQNPTSPAAIPRSTNHSGVPPIIACSLPAESTRNSISMRNGDSDSGSGSLQEARSVHFLDNRPVRETAVNARNVSDSATCMSSTVEPGRMGGFQVGYLGRPISESELYTWGKNCR